MSRIARFFLVEIALTALLFGGRAEPSKGVLSAAARLVEHAECPGGICAVLDAKDAEFALAVAKQGPFTLQCLTTGAGERDRLRDAIRSAGMYGAVSADCYDGKTLPYVANLVNLVFASPDAPLAEVVRVLAPLGHVFVAVPDGDEAGDRVSGPLRTAGLRNVSVIRTGADTWVAAQKPWPDDIDEWTHYLHGPDGNPVAQDRVVGPPGSYQWLSGPTWQRSHESDSSLSTLVTARGRLFSIVDLAPASVVGDHPLPDKWFLIAQDAFNGVTLWRVPIRRWGWREWKPMWFNYRPGDVPLNLQKRLVAVGDKVYATLGYRAPVSELDARTGEILRTYAGTASSGELLVLGDTLIVSVYEGDRLKVTRIDAKSGKPRWLTDETYSGTTTDYIKWGNRYNTFKPPKLDASLNLAADPRVVALIDGTDIVCLDAGTGQRKWRKAFPSDPSDENAGGIRARGSLWSGTMIVKDGVVLHASPGALAAFSADTGEILWTKPKHFIQHLWYEWKDVFVIDGLVWTWGADVARIKLEKGGGGNTAPQSLCGYDLKTGEQRRKVDLGPTFRTHHHHRCYRNKATVRYVIASRRGSEFVDLAGGPHTVDNWIRGTCHVGMMPANGLQYAPPHPCQCYLDEKLNGMNVMAPAREPAVGNGQQARRLEKGPAYDSPIPHSALAIRHSEDWPTFRCDGGRSGFVDTPMPEVLGVLWRADAGLRVSPPVSVGDRVYASLVDEHQVVCLDAASGRREWNFTAGARIDSPPTIYEGRVLFGAADGRVYCLRAGDGKLAWRFQAAPEERLIGAYGQLESAWPVHGSVLVQNGLAYCTAGRSSEVDGGIFLYALDPATGSVRFETRLSGPHYTSTNITQNYGLPMGSLPDILLGDGERVYMRNVAFDGELQRQTGKPEIQTGSGFLDDTYFKRVPWRFGGEYGRLLAHDKRSVYFVRMFDSLRGLDPSVYFTPGGKGYLLFAENAHGNKKTWSTRIPVRVRAMVSTPGRLFVAGPPDVVDPDDPLGAFEGRKGGVLYVFDSASGEKLSTQKLPYPPVFNGAAAANGRLFLTSTDGSVTCFGSARASR